MYGYDDLSVSAPHKVGKFKYVIGYLKKVMNQHLWKFILKSVN